jgi:FkbM family methyltransferase
MERMMDAFRMVATSPLAIGVRKFTRRIGLNLLISRLVWRGYEERFGHELLERIAEGDIVWDIGANVGLYTEKFANKAAQVVAFEPVPSSFEELVRHTRSLTNVIPVKVAMGSADGVISMELGSDPHSPNSRVVLEGKGQSTAGRCQVEVRSAESFVAERPDLFPNVIKVDVEGHEWAVLEGMKGLLDESRLRCVGVEVHFRILEERGESSRPRQIQSLLEKQGFKVMWPDASHIIGVR